MITAKRNTLVIAVLGLSMLASACVRNSASVRGGSSTLTQDEKHRLYTAALAASESPLDTDDFKNVCKRIGVFDANGKPNDNYVAFVSQHVDWTMKSESTEFRQQINSKEKAREYIKEHLATP